MEKGQEANVGASEQLEVQFVAHPGATIPIVVSRLVLRGRTPGLVILQIYSGAPDYVSDPESQTGEKQVVRLNLVGTYALTQDLAEWLYTNLAKHLGKSSDE
ncbi:hypothetical protein TJA_07600 [Thermus sp. LT1-2-5]|uniref:hypothetical protein n=1 Tax=Thermus sp. LT1-2-5 TaxID=3026935 RepID=UPI0030E972A3